MRDQLRVGASKAIEVRKPAPNYGASKPKLSLRAVDELAATSASAAVARKHAATQPVAMRTLSPRPRVSVSKEPYAYKGLGREPSPPFGEVC